MVVHTYVCMCVPRYMYVAAHTYIVTCLAFNLSFLSEPCCHGLEVCVVSLSYPTPGITSFLLIFPLLVATWRSAHCCTAEEFAPSSSTFSLWSQWLAFVDSLLMFSVLLLLSFSFSTSHVYTCVHESHWGIRFGMM